MTAPQEQQARDVSHWTDWSDSELIDQAAGACQHPALIDDAIVRDAIALNIIAPFRQKLARALSATQQPAAGQVEAVARAIFARRYPGAPFGPDVMCKGDDGTEIVAWEWLCGKDARAALAACQPDRLRECLEEARTEIVTAIAFLNRGPGPASSWAEMCGQLANRLFKTDEQIRSLLNPEQSAQVTL